MSVTRETDEIYMVTLNEGTILGNMIDYGKLTQLKSEIKEKARVLVEKTLKNVLGEEIKEE